MTLWLSIAVALSCVMLAAAGQDRSAQGSKVGVQYLGSSGQVKLLPLSDEQKFFKIQMNRLVELNADGTQSGCKSASFASLDASWSAPQTFQFSGNTSGTAILVNFTASVPLTGCGGGAAGSVDFTMYTYLYTVAGTTWNGNRSVSVNRDCVKFSVKLGNWPWQDVTHKLQFGIRVSSNRNGDPVQRTRNDTSHHERFGISGGAVDASTEAVVDGVNQPMGFVVTVSNAHTDLDFNFPYFASTLLYDPTLSVDEPSSPPPPGDASIRGAVTLGGLLVSTGLVLLTLV